VKQCISWAEYREGIQPNQITPADGTQPPLIAVAMHDENSAWLPNINGEDIIRFRII